MFAVCRDINQVLTSLFDRHCLAVLCFTGDRGSTNHAAKSFGHIVFGKCVSQTMLQNVENAQRLRYVPSATTRDSHMYVEYEINCELEYMA